MGAIGLREVPRALRFLRWALPDQWNIRQAPIPPNSRKVYSLDFALQNRRATRKGALMQTYCLRAQNT